MPRRYLLVKVLADESVTEDQFRDILTGAVRKSFGEIGYARIDPKLVRFDSKRSTAIVACKPSMVSELEAALSLICGGEKAPMAPLVLQVSGTIKGLQKRLN